MSETHDPVRIGNVATGDHILQVQIIRNDIAPGEPAALESQIDVQPGESVIAHLHERAALVITRKPFTREPRS